MAGIPEVSHAIIYCYSLLNEEESLQELHDWIVSVMESNHFSYEIIFMDDGSTDNSWQVISALVKNPSVKGIRFLRNYGKSQALHAGFKAAVGDVIITMDADLQDNPDEIPELYLHYHRRIRSCFWMEEKTVRFGYL